MITLSNNTKGLALLHQMEEYMGDSLLETVLYWGINCMLKLMGKKIVTILRSNFCLSKITVKLNTYQLANY